MSVTPESRDDIHPAPGPSSQGNIEIIGEQPPSTLGESSHDEGALSTSSDPLMKKTDQGSDDTNKATICYRRWIFFLSTITNLAVFATPVLFVTFYCLDTTHHYPKMRHVTPIGNCTVEIQSDSVIAFEELVIENEIKIIFAQLHLNKSVGRYNYSNVHSPSKWSWTDTKSHSKFLEWPESYLLWSVGLLDVHTQRNVHINLDLSPSGCSFLWGEPASTISIAEALFEMTKTVTKQTHLKRSKWCYSVKLKDMKSLLFERIFGFIVQDIGYHCCRIQTNISKSQFVDCDDNVYPAKMWTIVPFVIALLSLTICPNIFVCIYQYFSSKAHVYWIHQRHHTTNSTDHSTSKDLIFNDTWRFTDYKSPITFWSSLLSTFSKKCSLFCSGCCPGFICWGLVWLCSKIHTCCLSACCSKLSCSESCVQCCVLKRLLYSVLIVLISLSVLVLYILLCVCFPASHEMVLKAIEDDIPEGFLSLLSKNPFSHENFIYCPTVFLFLYVVAGLSYLMILQYFIKGKGNVENAKTDYALKLDLIEKHGRIHCTTREEFGIFETIHANYRAVLCPEFWKDSWDEFRKNGVFAWFIMLFYRCLHFYSFGFTCHLIHILCIHGLASCKKNLTKYLGAFCMTILHLFVVYMFTMIYFTSAEVIVLFFTFCFASIIVYPAAAAGVFIGVVLGLYLIIEKIHNFAKTYAFYRDLVISVSEELSQKSTGSEAKVVLVGGHPRLCISGVNILIIKHIKVVARNDDKMKDGELDCICKGKALKIVGRNIDELKSISLNSYKIYGANAIQSRSSVDAAGIKTIYRIKIGPSEIKCTDARNEVEGSRLNEETGGDRCTNGEDEDDMCFVRYKNGLPGIPEDLWKRVVDEYVPITTEIFRAVCLIGIILFVFWFNIDIILRYEQLVNLYSIMNCLVTLFLVRLSALSSLFSTDVEETQKKEILRRQIKLTVLEYWTARIYGSDETSIQTSSTPVTVRCDNDPHC